MFLRFLQANGDEFHCVLRKTKVKDKQLRCCFAILDFCFPSHDWQTSRRCGSVVSSGLCFLYSGRAPFCFERGSIPPLAVVRQSRTGAAFALEKNKSRQNSHYQKLE